jgi:hypothetical protein
MDMAWKVTSVAQVEQLEVVSLVPDNQKQQQLCTLERARVRRISRLREMPPRSLGTTSAAVCRQSYKKSSLYDENRESLWP